MTEQLSLYLNIYLTIFIFIVSALIVTLCCSDNSLIIHVQTALYCSFALPVGHKTSFRCTLHNDNKVNPIQSNMPLTSTLKASCCRLTVLGHALCRCTTFKVKVKCGISISHVRAVGQRHGQRDNVACKAERVHLVRLGPSPMPCGP